ncbi:MAG: DMT family transporter [Barnesiella sp.]
MNREKIKGHAAMLVASVIFGLNIPVSKSIMINGWMSSTGLTYLRMFVATIAFWLISLFFPREPVTRRDMFILFFGGILGILLNQGSFIIGLGYTSPIDAGLIVTVSPVLVMLLSAMVLKEPVTLKKTGGVFLGGAGAIIIILSGASGVHSAGSNPLLGNLLCLSGALFYSVYLIITKPIMQRYTPITLMKWMFLYSALLSMPFGLPEILGARAFTAETQISVLLRLGYITLLATFFTFFLIPVALKRIRPTTVSMYNYVQPLVASIAAILAGQDALTWEKPIAAACIFAGVYMVTQSKSRADVLREKTESNR